ncbi:MAG TPA: hypothetical protein PKM73_10620 [Verrucomicrobiota bacterium]|nr:hypothetical protein [Verrucomicrobiota bacterium]HNU52164.1 hypothetical protein [Verrucomicrobiota bacterium]
MNRDAIYQELQRRDSVLSTLVNSILDQCPHHPAMTLWNIC